MTEWLWFADKVKTHFPITWWTINMVATFSDEVKTSPLCGDVVTEWLWLADKVKTRRLWFADEVKTHFPKHIMEY